MSDDGAEGGEATVDWGSPTARWVLVATIGASALTLMDATAVTVALPTIGADLDVPLSSLQWVLNAYALSLAALVLLAGSLGDRFGRRRVFVVGIVWFTASSVLAAVAPTIEVLLLARASQGIGAALLTPGSLAIIHATFAAEVRPRAIGAWAGIGGVAAALGPLIGGVAVDAAGWRPVFLLGLPVAVVALWATLRHVPSGPAGRADQRFDLAGAALVTAGLGAVTWALIAAGTEGSATAAAATGVAGGAALVAFVVVERRAVAPLVPLELFRSRRFSGVNAVTFLVYGAMGALFFLLVVHLQVVVGFGPLLAGSALVPVTGLMLVLSPYAGDLAARVGPRVPIAVGPLFMAAGCLLFARLDAGASLLTDVLPGLIVFGLGLAAMVTPLTATALAAAPDDRAGVASGINNAVSRTGSLLAVAGLPPLAGLTGAALSDPSRFAPGFTLSMQVSAGLLLLGAVVGASTIGPADEPLPALAGPGRPPHRCPVDGAPLHLEPAGAGTDPERGRPSDR